MKILSLIVSILSIIISSIVAYIQISKNKQLNQINMDFSLYKEIYIKYFIEEIPNASSKISFDENDKLVNYKELIDVIISLLEHNRCYEFLDNKYYSELKEIVLELEDFLLESGNLEKCNEKRKNSIDIQKNELISKLYKLSYNKFFTN